DGRGHERFEELGGGGVPFAQLAASALVRPRGEEASAPPELDERSDGRLALPVNGIVGHSTGERVGRISASAAVVAVAGLYHVAEPRLEKRRVDLLAGGAVLGDDVLVEPGADHAVDGIARGSQRGPAGVGDRDKGAVEE